MNLLFVRALLSQLEEKALKPLLSITVTVSAHTEKNEVACSRVKSNRDLASRRRPKAAICIALTQTNVTLSCCSKMPRECCHNQLK